MTEYAQLLQVSPVRNTPETWTKVPTVLLYRTQRLALDTCFSRELTGSTLAILLINGLC